jgi:hypothetical protein
MPSTQTRKEMFGSGRRSNRGGKPKKAASQNSPENKIKDTEDPTYISSTSLASTAYGSIAATVLATSSAVSVFVKALGIQNISNYVVYGTFVLAAGCIIAITVLIGIGLQVRGATKVAAIGRGDAGGAEFGVAHD